MKKNQAPAQHPAPRNQWRPLSPARLNDPSNVLGNVINAFVSDYDNRLIREPERRRRVGRREFTAEEYRAIIMAALRAPASSGLLGYTYWQQQLSNIPRFADIVDYRVIGQQAASLVRITNRPRLFQTIYGYHPVHVPPYDENNATQQSIAFRQLHAEAVHAFQRIVRLLSCRLLPLNDPHRVPELYANDDVINMEWIEDYRQRIIRRRDNNGAGPSN